MTKRNSESTEVTVITALYNNKSYIESCIKSLKNQTFKNYKHLIIDDFSTDGSYEHALEIVKNFNNVEIYRMESNKGYQEVLNFGIRKSTTDYVAILDSDDIAIDYWLEVVLNCFKLNKIGVVGGGAVLMDGEGVIANVKRFGDLAGDVTDLIRRGGYPILHTGICYRKRYLEKVGLYSTDMKSAEDSDILLGLSFLTRIYSVGVPLIYYRRLPSSESRKTVEYSNALNNYLSKKNNLLSSGYSVKKSNEYLYSEIQELKKVKRIKSLDVREYYLDMALIFAEGKKISRSLFYLSKVEMRNLRLIYALKLLAIYLFPIKFYLNLSQLLKKILHA